MTANHHSPPSKRGGALVKGLTRLGASVVLIALTFLTGCFLHTDVVEAPPNTAPSKLCGDCHVHEYKEWKESEHASAHSSENFKRQTDNYEIQKCLTCHVAAPIYGQEKLTIRHNNKEEGVNCVTCHLTPEQELAGPLFVLPAHYTKMEDPYYKDSRMCGKCHEEHLDEWNKTKETLATDKKLETCQDCHMPSAYRKMIPEGFFQYAHWRQEVKKHSFHAELSPDNKDPWVKIQYEYQEDPKTHLVTIDVTVNHRIPHSLPSGTFGFKAVDLIVALKSERGLALKEQSHTFYVEQKGNIKPGETKKHRFQFSLSERVNAEFLEFRVNRRKSRMDFGRTIHQEQHRI